MTDRFRQGLVVYATRGFVCQMIVRAEQHQYDLSPDLVEQAADVVVRILRGERVNMNELRSRTQLYQELERAIDWLRDQPEATIDAHLLDRIEKVCREPRGLDTFTRRCVVN